MPFEPRYIEGAEDEFIDNLMAVTERDMKPALDYFDQLRHGGTVTDNLPGFAIMTDGEVSVFKYPLITLVVQRVVSVETTQLDEADVLDQVLTAGAGLVVSSTKSVADARAIARKYVRAFKSVLRSAPASDLFPETARIFNHSIETDHRYFKTASEGANFVQACEIAIRIKFGES